VGLAQAAAAHLGTREQCWSVSVRARSGRRKVDISNLALHLVTVWRTAALEGHATAHRRRQDAQSVDGAHRLRDGVGEREGTRALAAQARTLAKATHGGHFDAARAAEETQLDDHVRVVLEHADRVRILQRLLADECAAIASAAAETFALAPATEGSRDVAQVAGHVVADTGTEDELALGRAVDLEAHC